MLTQILWWLGNALIGVLLVFAVRGRLFRKYLLFYLYLSLVLSLAFLRFYIHTFLWSAYLSFYWYTEFLSIAVGYGVMWEIYSQTFKDYPGTARVAQFVVSCVFVVVVGKSVIEALLRQEVKWSGSVIGLERNLRAVQAVLLIFVLALIFHYGIPLGRNLRGLLWGYGLFVGTGVITLTLRSHLGPAFQISWGYLQQISYLLTLLVWTVALRSYQPNPIPEYKVELEGDYQFVAERTLQAITRARAYLLRATLS